MSPEVAAGLLQQLMQVALGPGAGTGPVAQAPSAQTPVATQPASQSQVTNLVVGQASNPLPFSPPAASQLSGWPSNAPPPPSQPASLLSQPVPVQCPTLLSYTSLRLPSGTVLNSPVPQIPLQSPGPSSIQPILGLQNLSAGTAPRVNQARLASLAAHPVPGSSQSRSGRHRGCGPAQSAPVLPRCTLEPMPHIVQPPSGGEPLIKVTCQVYPYAVGRMAGLDYIVYRNTKDSWMTRLHEKGLCHDIDVPASLLVTGLVPQVLEHMLSHNLQLHLLTASHIVHEHERLPLTLLAYRHRGLTHDYRQGPRTGDTVVRLEEHAYDSSQTAADLVECRKDNVFFHNKYSFINGRFVVCFVANGAFLAVVPPSETVEVHTCIGAEIYQLVTSLCARVVLLIATMVCVFAVKGIITSHM
ncbi:hypothetical protein DAEQUDRAFT_739280 [Daedalea quercina L-15889]|uniref:Uncharacterized protein n=1 Tax=Daedalea quercina L-15889 TaxID=1314783 RepID=A0A165NXD6_9APHY|nr:hypothetical protein DAEQUDRAFT_739280 [Daedalea quercina L-15889]